MKWISFLAAYRYGLLWPFALILMLLNGISCKPAPARSSDIPVYGRYDPPFHQDEPDSTMVYAVVEVPAGTSVLRALDTTMQIRPLSEKPIDFLPFPGNYGFIAGCAKTDTATGLAQPLPVMILMSSLEAGSRLWVRPVAALALTKSGSPYPVVVAVPVDPALKSIEVRNFVDLITEYDPVRQILEAWFLNYLGRQAFEFAGWKDEHYAYQLIAEWKISQ